MTLATAARWGVLIWVVATIGFGLLALTDPASGISSFWQFALGAIIAYPICVLGVWSIGDRVSRMRRDIAALRAGRDDRR